MICLSQKSGLPDIGDFIFRNSMTARMQARTIADFAFNKLGLTRFAILYPKDSYGETMMNAALTWIYQLQGDL